MQAGQMMMPAMMNNQQHRNQKPKNNNTPAGQQYQPLMPMQPPAKFEYGPSGIHQAQSWTPQPHRFYAQQCLQQNVQCLQQGGQQNMFFNSLPNPQKRFNNYNYCRLHGCDIPDWHPSGMCNAPRQGHMWNATQQNQMN
eukprot:1193112-Ditylum_brightwellii.AAC.1